MFARRIIPPCAAALLAALFFAAPAQAQTNVATTNGAGTITTGSTFQQLYAAITTGQAVRRSITIQNNNTNGDNCWLFIGPTASATKGTSILLGPGGSYQRYYPYVPSDAFQITCATTSDSFYADTQ